MDHWLKQLREEADLTQDELAARLQLEGHKATRSAVGNWETGRAPVPIKDLEFVKSLASILRVTENQVMLMAGYRVGSKHTQVSERIANMVDDLPPDKQDLALRIIEQIKR